MIDRDLRNVLLIKAIEETDLSGEIIPLADRATASREALRQAGAPALAEQPAPALRRDSEGLLAARSERLVRPLLTRYPFLHSLLALLEGPAWVNLVLLIVCLMLGISMAAVDGDNRIDILGFPLLLLVLWNFTVYALLLVHAARGAAAKRGAGAAPGLYSRWVALLTRHLLTRSSRFNAPLTASLQRFTTEWLRVSRPTLLARGASLFHLASACVATGLIAALYFRGIWRGYRAGWDSTWPDIVPPLLRIFYGPASWLTHIPLPARDPLASLRWSAGPGEPAAPWIHLMAVTALLFIMGPRLVLAAGYALRSWNLKRSAPVPASLALYLRAVLGPAGLPPGRGIVSLIPYSYEPSPEAMAALRGALLPVFGERVALDARPAVAFGQEEKFLAGLPAQQDAIADCLAVLMNLASTPENENHGLLLVGLRDWLSRSHSRTQLLVMVDEGPYTSRMSGAPERLTERRAFWLRFLNERGLRGALLDLRPGSRTGEVATTTLIREALQAPEVSA